MMPITICSKVSFQPGRVTVQCPLPTPMRRGLSPTHAT